MADDTSPRDPDLLADGARHLPFVALAALAARMCLVEAHLEDPGQFARSVNRTFRKNVKRSWILPDRDSATRADASLAYPLTSYVRETLDRIATDCKKANGATAQWGQAVSRAATAFSCEHCGSNHKCRKQYNRDTLAVARYGLCLRHLSALFNEASGLATALYRQKLPNAQSPVLRMNTFEAERGAKLVLNAAADRRDGDIIDIDFYFDVDNFEWIQFTEFFYIAFHEIFVHAWAGVPPSGARASASAVFSEGLMDWLAVEIIKRNLNTANGNVMLTAGTANPSVVGRAPELFSWAAVSAHSRRCSPYGYDEDESPVINYTGEFVGQRLLWLFEALSGNPEAGWNALLNLCVVVNHSDLSHDERNAFIEGAEKVLLLVETDSDTGKIADNVRGRAKSFLDGKLSCVEFARFLCDAH